MIPCNLPPLQCTDPMITLRKLWLYMSVVGLLAAAGCAGSGEMPRLKPVSSAAAASCRHSPPPSGLQLLHQAQFSDAQGGTHFFQSVTLIGDGAQRVRSVILSPEAMVLFDGVVTATGSKVIRALGPFANPQLSRRLLNDVGLVYLAPGPLIAGGETDDGCRVCRYCHYQDTIVDRLRCPDDERTLQQYDAKGHLVRLVKFGADVVTTPDHRDRAPAAFELQAFGQIAYQIKFKLIDLQQVK